MIQWTDGANKEWESYCNKVRELLGKTGADPGEVIDDVRRHIEAELETSGIKVVTQQDVKRLLARIGMPDINQLCSEPEGSESVLPVKPLDHAASPGAKGGVGIGLDILIVIFGVLFPIIALLVELGTRICTEAFFDPVPTVWHVLLFLLIPLANVLSVVGVRRNAASHYSKLGLLNATGIGVAIMYTILFLPIMPMSIIGIMAMGLGLCGLAPVTSLAMLIIARYRLKRLAPANAPARVPCFWPGLIVSVVAMLAVILPGALTQMGIEMATSESPQMQLKGISLLRAVGSEDRLLVACYRRFGIMTDFFSAIISAGDPASPEEVRGIYYRVTGKPFNSVSPPVTGSFGVRSREPIEWDIEEGDDAVGTQLKGLSLVSSRIDGSMDSDAAVGYIEWTMIFKNSHQWQQRETRCQIQLPPGGVVSRLTLWIDGEEREAAFGSRSQTRQAYQSVVRRRRDPVLVTTCGPDRVLVQCFPVEPGGRDMKIRIGITTPLVLPTDSEATMMLPHFNERNFAVPESTKHAIWVESKQAISTTNGSLVCEAAKNDLYATRGDIADTELFGKSGVLTIARSSAIQASWARDSFGGTNDIVLQTIKPAKVQAPGHLVLVLDTSATMGPVLPEVAEAIVSLSSSMPVSVVLAEDSVRELSPEPVKMSPAEAEKLAQSIRRLKAQGGMDNVPALRKARDRSLQIPGSVIVWIHAGQPQLFESAEMLRQHWERRPDGAGLIEVQVVPGVDKVVEALDGLAQVHALAFTGNTGTDLKRLFESWGGDAEMFSLERRRMDASLRPTSGIKETSSHIVRLWAKDEVDRLRLSKADSSRQHAVELAHSYQLVTPVSGAVVLETKAQYDAAGLEPAAPATVPTIPEPETWALLVIVAIALCWAMSRRRLSLRAA